MKQTALIVLLFCCFGIHSQSLYWNRSTGGTENDESFSIVVDANGYSYTTGCFADTVDFDPGPGVYELATDGTADAYVQKLDPDGNLVWAFKLGSAGFDIGYELVIDYAGDIIIGGKYAGTVDFDPGPGTMNLTAGGSTEAFIMKIDSDMNLIWARSTQGMAGDDTFFTGLGVDGDNHLYCEGFMEGPLDVDPGPGVFTVGTPGFYTFKLKLSSTGNFIWATELPYHVLKSIYVDEDGNIYTTGQFSGTVDFDPSPGVLSKTSTFFEDIYVSKVDSSGTVVWVAQIEGYGYGEGVTSNATGDIWVCGNFNGTADFDPGAAVYSVTDSGFRDVFILKLDGSGNFQWVKTVGGPSWDYGIGLDRDGLDNVYVTGQFEGSVDFDPSAGTDILTSPPSTINAFVMKLATDGSYEWAIATEGVKTIGREITVDNAGDIYYTGVFEDSCDFDPSVDKVNEHFAPGPDNSFFVSKLSPCGKIVDLVDSACYVYSYDGNTYTASGNYEINYSTGADCDSIVRLDITIKEVNTNVLYSGGILTAYETSADSYQWVDCDDGYSAISGEDGVSFTPSGNGNYAVIIDDGECVDTSDCYLVDDVGIQVKSTHKLNIYPNPCSTFITVQGINESAAYSIVDSQGRVISSGLIESDKIEVATISNGVYYLIISEDEIEEKLRIIIAH